MARHAAPPKRCEDSRAVWKVLLALWIVFIWAHSLIPGPASSDESMLFVSLIRPLFEIVGVHDVEIMQLVVRKVAHFSEYLALGLLLVVALQPRLAPPLIRALAVLALWAAVPCIDELVIQVRVPGRSGTVQDVLIDVAGCFVGVAVALLMRRSIERRMAAQAERERRAREARAEHYRRKTRRANQERAERFSPQRGRHLR